MFDGSHRRRMSHLFEGGAVVMPGRARAPGPMTAGGERSGPGTPSSGSGAGDRRLSEIEVAVVHRRPTDEQVVGHPIIGHQGIGTRTAE